MDNIYTNGAREALNRGVQKAKGVVAGTFGPTGYSVVLQENLWPFHSVRDDGYEALKRIKLTDPLEQLGVELLLESVEKSNKESGDGSTTSTILTAAILEEGLKLDTHGKEIKDSLDECLPIIEKAIDDQTKQITPDEVGQIATTSSGDPQLGNLIQEIYSKVGKDGVIELDNSGTPITSYEIVDGVRLHNCGFLHELMTNDGKQRSATMLNSKVLIIKQPINSTKEIDPLLQTLMSNGINQLVVFYKEISDPVLQYMAEAHMKGLFKFLLIKAPTLWQDWLYEDFAVITGAKIIDPQLGTSLQMMGTKLTWLGSCEKIVAHKDETLVFPHPENIGAQSAFAQHLEKLKEDGKKDDQQLLRASWLQTKTAILKVGANSESELSLKKAKVEDARNAAYQALQGGIVKGAGQSLLNIDLPNTIGGKILTDALEKPTQQLTDNMGKAPTEEVYDPAPVIKNAIRNAISVAGTILTSNAVILLPETK